MTTHAPSQSLSRSFGILNSLTDAWTRYRKRRAAVAELQALGHNELERMVQDAGVTFGDLLALARQNGDSAQLLYRRLEQAGIDFKASSPPCCATCSAAARCARASRNARMRSKIIPKAASWPHYCPNRQTIEALGSAKCH